MEVTGIILRMIAPDAPADVIVEGDALTEIEEDGPAGVSLAEAGVILYDRFRQDGWAIAFAARKGLGIVRLIAMHPGGDDGIAAVGEAGGTLIADDRAAARGFRDEALGPQRP